MLYETWKDIRPEITASSGLEYIKFQSHEEVLIDFEMNERWPSLKIFARAKVARLDFVEGLILHCHDGPDS